jgi:hypothetical protein
MLFDVARRVGAKSCRRDRRPEPGRRADPGIYCTVDLQIPPKSQSLLIPANAIIVNRDGLHGRRGSGRHIRKISVARHLGTQVEMRDGVKAGEPAA